MEWTALCLVFATVVGSVVYAASVDEECRLLEKDKVVLDNGNVKSNMRRRGVTTNDGMKVHYFAERMEGPDCCVKRVTLKLRGTNKETQVKIPCKTQLRTTSNKGVFNYCDLIFEDSQGVTFLSEGGQCKRIYLNSFSTAVVVSDEECRTMRGGPSQSNTMDSSLDKECKLLGKEKVVVENGNVKSNMRRRGVTTNDGINLHYRAERMEGPDCCVTRVTVQLRGTNKETQVKIPCDTDLNTSYNMGIFNYCDLIFEDNQSVTFFAEGGKCKRKYLNSNSPDVFVRDEECKKLRDGPGQDNGIVSGASLDKECKLLEKEKVVVDNGNVKSNMRRRGVTTNDGIKVHYHAETMEGPDCCATRVTLKLRGTNKETQVKIPCETDLSTNYNMGIFNYCDLIFEDSQGVTFLSEGGQCKRIYLNSFSTAVVVSDEECRTMRGSPSQSNTMVSGASLDQECKLLEKENVVVDNGNVNSNMRRRGVTTTDGINVHYYAERMEGPDCCVIRVTLKLRGTNKESQVKVPCVDDLNTNYNMGIFNYNDLIFEDKQGVRFLSEGDQCKRIYLNSFSNAVVVSDEECRTMRGGPSQSNTMGAGDVNQGHYADSATPHLTPQPASFNGKPTKPSSPQPAPSRSFFFTRLYEFLSNYFWNLLRKE